MQDKSHDAEVTICFFRRAKYKRHVQKKKKKRKQKEGEGRREKNQLEKQ